MSIEKEFFRKEKMVTDVERSFHVIINNIASQRMIFNRKRKNDRRDNDRELENNRYASSGIIANNYEDR